MRKNHKNNFNLHSIPICKKNSYLYNKLRYVSYSIPLGCVGALLLVLGIAISPAVPSGNDSYALESEEVADDTEVVEVDSNDNINAGIDLQAASASIGISGAAADAIVSAVQAGGTVYRDHNITITANDITTSYCHFMTPIGCSRSWCCYYLF